MSLQTHEGPADGGEVRSRRSRPRFVRPLVIGALGALAAAALSALPTTSAAFTDVTGNGSSELATAVNFCQSPGTRTLTVVHDTMVVQDQATSSFGGTRPIEVRARNGQARRILLDTALPTLPAWCDVTSASLSMTTLTASPSRTYLVHRLNGSWTWSSVTWASQPPPTGTPASASPSAGTTTWDVTGPVQGLYRFGNTGLVIRDSSESPATGFTSSFEALPGPAAQLTVTWA